MVVGGEQILPFGGICNLASINLTQFVDVEKKIFDFDKIRKYAKYGVRFLDNISDLSNYPLPEYEQFAKDYRRVGLGVLGWGSALYMLKIRFGSEEASNLRDELMRVISHSVYDYSADLAAEKGKFPKCDPIKHAETKFVKQIDLPEDTLEKIRRYGVRNSSLMSQQPTGNTSIFANVVSGGIEPVFMPEYIRTVIVNTVPDEIKEVTPKWWEGEWKETKMFKFSKEGDEDILSGEFNGTTYKIDKNRGLTKEVPCEDYGVRWLKKRGEWDSSADWAVSTLQLTPQDHITDLMGFSKYTDSSISKCVVKGTKISTNKGILSIEDLSDDNLDEDSFGDLNDDYYVLDMNGDKKKVTSFYYGGHKPSFELKFSNGYSIKAATTHKLKTTDGWKSVSKIKEGDKVLYRKESMDIDSCEYVTLMGSPCFYNCIERDFPQQMTEDFAKFIGMYLADGFSTVNGFGIVEKNPVVGAEITRLMYTLFGTTAAKSIDKRSGVVTHSINSRAISKFLDDYLGKRCNGKRVPNDIMISSHSVKKAFIEGLTLDGYLTESKLVIYEGYSENIAKNTAEILASMGVVYYLGRKSVPTGRLSAVSYSVAAYMDQRLFDPIEPHKKEYSISGKQCVQTYLEDVDKFMSLPDYKDSEYFYYRNLRKSLSKENCVRVSLLDKLSLEYDSNLQVITVTSKEDIGLQEVYDIEVEDTHSYLIGGIVSHNTINLPNDFSFESFKEVYIEAYNSGYIKGCTTYRSGTMASVLSGKKEEDEEIIQDHVKLPDSAEASLKTIKAEGKKWYLTITYFDGTKKPFALFVKTNAHEKNVVTNNAIELLENLAREKQIPVEHIEGTLEKSKQDNNASKITRMISLLLRHGVLIKNIVTALDKVDGAYVGTFIFQIKKFLATYIKDGEKVEGEICQECGSDKVIFQEGCKVCSSCGSSKCG